MRCAVVQNSNNTVINLIVADPSTDIAPDGCRFVGLPSDSPVDIGWTYNPSTGQFTPPTPSVPTAEENKQTAIQLLKDTDWVNEPDVTNPANNPHLLNKDAFDAYRVAVRQYAVYPVAGNINWPTKPEEQWSS